MIGMRIRLLLAGESETSLPLVLRAWVRKVPTPGSIRSSDSSATGLTRK